MNARPLSSPRYRLVAATATAAAICLLPAGVAFGIDSGPSQSVSPVAAVPVATADASPAEAAAVLASTPWQTTGAVDQDGVAVALDDPRAVNFVGNAYFKADGTFTMYNLDDSPKMQGAWEMRVENGQLVRWIAAKNDAGVTLFERVVPIVALTAGEFTYRVAAQDGSYVDIVHTPTTHAEPGTVDLGAAAAVLASTPWQTTGAVDQDGVAVALDDPRAVNFVGNAYFKADGTFTMYNLDDSPKMQGAWEMRVENGQLVRWIAAKNDAGVTLFERVVPIVALTAGEFTYRVAAQDGSYVDIVHTPTTHAEPGTAQTGEDPSDVNDESDRAEAPSAGAAAAAQSPTRLAATGADAPLAGLIAAASLMLGGALILARRVLRRALG